MMGDPRDLMEDSSRFERVQVTNEDKTDTRPEAFVPWEEMLAHLEAVDPRVAAQMNMMSTWGLRFKEAVLLRPNLDDLGDRLRVERGSKGGNGRSVMVRDPEQHKSLARLKEFAVSKNGGTIPMDKTQFQWGNYVRNICNKVGFTKKGCGYTPYSLQHAYDSWVYEAKAAS
jgi:integrase